MTSLKQRFTDLRPVIDAATASHLDDAISSFGAPEPGAAFYEAARTAIAGGKRFRALLAQLGAALARGEELVDAPLLPLGAALELYQASALVHDDIIDHAPTRRGTATTHTRFADDHARRRLIGDPREFGTAVAILAGDLLFSAAERAVARQCDALDHQRSARLLSAYSRMHAEVAYGQYLDVAAEQVPLATANDDAVDCENARRVVLHKSARYSIVHPTLLGAIAAGADDRLLGAIERVLEPWGIAFQLRDDELGVFGDPTVTGKPAGDDIREGKRTVLLGLTWRNATAGEREALAHIIGHAHPTAADINRVRDIIAHRGAGAHERMIHDLVNQGDAALDDPLLSGAAREELAALADIIVVRDR